MDIINLLQFFIAKKHPSSLHNITYVAETNPSLKEDAEEVSTKFSTLFEHFGKCHHGFNSSSYMSDNDIDKLGMYRSTLYQNK